MGTRLPGRNDRSDWDDRVARTGLVDALAKDAMGVLAVLDGRELDDGLGAAAALLATLVSAGLSITSSWPGS